MHDEVELLGRLYRRSYLRSKTLATHYLRSPTLPKRSARAARSPLECASRLQERRNNASVIKAPICDYAQILLEKYMISLIPPARIVCHQPPSLVTAQQAASGMAI